MKNVYLTHRSPIWQERANFILHARVEGDDPSVVWEQIWARQLAATQFEVCCIPMFVYDLALGDIIETGPSGGHQYVVQRVVQPSQHYTFRALFSDGTTQVTRDHIAGELGQLGALVEWYSDSLMAISAEPVIAQTVADFLCDLEERELLSYETGRTA